MLTDFNNSQWNEGYFISAWRARVLVPSLSAMIGKRARQAVGFFPAASSRATLDPCFIRLLDARTRERAGHVQALTSRGRQADVLNHGHLGDSLWSMHSRRHGAALAPFFFSRILLSLSAESEETRYRPVPSAFPRRNCSLHLRH